MRIHSIRRVQDLIDYKSDPTYDFAPRFMSLITLTTDFGSRDYYVAAVKGVLLSRAPEARLVDIGHDVAPGDIEGAAFLLEASFPYFPPDTVHLAVVDPGVGSERRILIIETGRGARLIAPDNGLLDGFLDSAKYLISAERRDLYLDGPGATFHGRDRFAPLAAALSGGLSSRECGPPLTDPIRLDRPRPKKSNGLLQGRVNHIDQYGNVVTDIPASWIPKDLKAHVQIIIHEVVIENRADFYSEIACEEDFFLVGSLGFLELSRNGESLADLRKIRRGQKVEVRFNR